LRKKNKERKSWRRKKRSRDPPRLNPAFAIGRAVAVHRRCVLIGGIVQEREDRGN
jgi:hypothetical protein